MNLKKIYVTSGMLVGILLLISFGLTSWYTVDESDQAVLSTFGKLEDTIQEPGLHFKLPWPIQKVNTVSRETFSLQFGYNQENGRVSDEKPEDTKMITGDENIVLADLVVQWRITNIRDYLYNADSPEQILYNATSASLRGIIGSSRIDDALTSGKAQIENDVRDLLTDLINSYNIGITVVSVKLQDVDLPNEEVRNAFTRVTDARETMNTKINEAERYANKRLNEAQGEKDALISNAEGDKAARVEQARGDIARFQAIYKEYKNAPDLTENRLIFETLDTVLPNAQIYIMNEEGGTVKYLPIQPQPKEVKNRSPQLPEGSGQ